MKNYVCTTFYCLLATRVFREFGDKKFVKSFDREKYKLYKLDVKLKTGKVSFHFPSKILML
jgi:hypothetical protein